MTCAEKSMQGANTLVPFHEVYSVRTHDRQTSGLSQLSYVVFVSQARHRESGELAHMHWFTYTEDPSGVPGRYGDAALARITRSHTISKERSGETLVRESFRAVGELGKVQLSVAYAQGGQLNWLTPEQPNLVLRSARDPRIERWYREDQVIDVVRSDPLGTNRVSELEFHVRGELADVFDGTERVVAVVIQRPYMRQVFVPEH
jgi:hypothetical protein